ncbi:tetratricopeptide repeat protein [Hippea alviniae]|uniref:tetratricopeptide repeat protein n=1 Tax=Hippea alviniae TaxID=1279027 RepID=UPI0003B30FD8|nr:tetratricopeptide repeat protein [Hippea alviniae]
MSVNVEQIFTAIIHSQIAIFTVGLFIGALLVYIALISKQKKENIDKRKLESYIKGINYIIEDETDKAIQELTATAKLDPDMIDIYVSIGNLFRKKGEINRALIIHKSLLAKSDLSKDKKLEIYLNVGIDYRKAGLYDRAKKYFKDALSIDPKNMTAKRMLYEVYEDSRDWENALVWHKRFDGTDKHILAHIYTELGKDKLKENDTEAAKKNFEKALKEYKECVDALLHLGDIYFNYGKLEKAYQLWESVCKIRPELCNLALSRIKDETTLKKAIKNLLYELPDNQFILFFAAESYFSINQEKKALSLYKKLIKNGISSLYILKRYLASSEADDKFIKLFLSKTDIRPIRYTCTNCGHSAYKLSFRCPKCKTWDKLKVEIV